MEEHELRAECARLRDIAVRAMEASGTHVVRTEFVQDVETGAWKFVVCAPTIDVPRLVNQIAALLRASGAQGVEAAVMPSSATEPEATQQRPPGVGDPNPGIT